MWVLVGRGDHSHGAYRDTCIAVSGDLLCIFSTWLGAQSTGQLVNVKGHAESPNILPCEHPQGCLNPASQKHDSSVQSGWDSADILIHGTLCSQYIFSCEFMKFGPRSNFLSFMWLFVCKHVTVCSWLMGAQTWEQTPLSQPKLLNASPPFNDFQCDSRERQKSGAKRWRQSMQMSN